MCLFEHMRGTTGKDPAARREKNYARRCSQCGVTVTSTTRVAAHVKAYPLGLGRGIPTLRTTCKTCNHARNKQVRFWGFKFRLRRLGDQTSKTVQPPVEVRICGTEYEEQHLRV